MNDELIPLNRGPECGEQESECAWGEEEIDRTTLDDYVAAHGCGVPTNEGYALARKLWTQGADYATIAHEIVYRQLTIEEGNCKRDGEPPRDRKEIATNLR